jgi:ABC-2 type transport system ATP-binding protein
MTLAIETQDLTKRFSQTRPLRSVLFDRSARADRIAVDGVNLSIPSGEVFGLLGQNGAGKTTLVRMLTTLLLPTSGTALADGLDVVKHPREVRSRIGLINGDERSFYWRLTGRQNLEFFAALGGLTGKPARTRADGLLDAVGLTASAGAAFRTYSGGMRQKLGIARGLLGDPEVLFLDEPSRSLDPISAREVRALISGFLVGELSRTVVLATHSLPEAEELCHRLALVRDGRLVAQGTVAELRRAFPHGVRCELLLPAVPTELPGALRRLPEVRDVDVTMAPGGWLLGVALAGEREGLAAVLREVVGHGSAVHDCTVREATLEDVYVRALAGPPAGAATEALAC